jgi:hypothetical protein
VLPANAPHHAAAEVVVGAIAVGEELQEREQPALGRRHLLLVLSLVAHSGSSQS